MSLRSQVDAQARTLDVEVRAVEASGDRWRVVVPDTVIHPEGGGQPSDRGTLGGVPVLQAERTPLGVILELAGPLEPGVHRMEVDWARRFDHMQQHTGQHLITALAEERFGLPTIAFHLGQEASDIEVDAREVSAETLRALEDLVNQEIRTARPVTVDWVQPEALAGLDVRSRGLPEGLDGPVRLVGITGLDLNTCGGTHVRNTAEVQVVKLLHTERLKRGIRLYWLAGHRVLRRFAGCLEREQGLCERLSCGPEEHLRAVDRLLTEDKAAARSRRLLLDEMADLIARDLAGRGSRVATLHRDDADVAWLNLVASKALTERPGLLLLLTGPGVFVVAGPPDDVARLGPEVARVLGGRGGGARGRYQGKAERVDRRAEAALLLAGA